MKINSYSILFSKPTPFLPYAEISLKIDTSENNSKEFFKNLKSKWNHRIFLSFVQKKSDVKSFFQTGIIDPNALKGLIITLKDEGELKKLSSSRSFITLIFKTHDLANLDKYDFDKDRNIFFATKISVLPSSYNELFKNNPESANQLINSVRSKVTQAFTDTLVVLRENILSDDELREYIRIKRKAFAEMGINFNELVSFLQEQNIKTETIIYKLGYILINDVDDLQQFMFLDLLGQERQIDKEIKKIVSKISKIENSLEDEINRKVRHKLENYQREYYLRAKRKAIDNEIETLTNGSEPNEVERYENKLIELNPPKHIYKAIKAEIKSLKSQANSIGSPTRQVSINYLETVLSLPYSNRSDDNLDIKKVREILNEDHFGLEKAKVRILEYIALKGYNKKNDPSKGTVICFDGPPGTGKTSLSKSIARALNRKFVKISLGGISSESEIRGHRKTYIGAMPGKIIAAMKKAQTINPVILLDEIDKVSTVAGYNGDPSSALLEVLDPEQNSNFQDHYLEFEYDLSKVLFIASSNEIYNIPRPLLDRFEIIELSSYTELEKFNIAKSYLIPRIIKKHSIPKGQFKVSDETINLIIDKYTRESGVRNLNRVLEQTLRKLILEALSSSRKLKSRVITPKMLEKLLGVPRFNWSKKLEKNSIGIVTGLAWTSVGGDILPIETSIYPGKGEITITGSLKDVMNESAKLAVNFIKSNAKAFKVDKLKLSEYDIHIHSPDGATPKDGPSAGVTFTTSLLSSMLKKPVSNNIAMTGEITLSGRVFPIGGLKEKLIAASRSKIKQVFIPFENVKDLKEIPQEVKSNLEIIPVKNYKEIYDKIF